MNRKQYETMRNQLMNEAQTLINDGKAEEAEAKMNEVKDLDEKWDKIAQAQANFNALNNDPKPMNPFSMEDSLSGQGSEENPVATAWASKEYENAWAKAMMKKPLEASEQKAFDLVNEAYTHTTGNTAIVKPSAYSPATSEVIAKIIKKCFPEEYVAVILGGRKENAALLEEKFDFVFFTGSQAVGKEVLRHTAEHLTPTVLELGGKSPCIVDESANIKLAAKRVVWGKYLNCGQTCVAPDYVLCEQSIKDEFVVEVIKQIKRQFGENPLDNKDYGKIINEKHFKRLCNLIDKKKVLIGGEINSVTCQISPTVMDNVTANDAVMGEEIFGPIMPIITFNDFDSVITELKEKDKPLALYLFSSNKKHIKRVTTELSYGGGCINDVVIHLATSEMPFGGVGESGMGGYHGKDGFDAFSHYKSIVDKKTWMDLPMRYQPFKSRLYESILHIFLK